MAEYGPDCLKCLKCASRTSWAQFNARSRCPCGGRLQTFQTFQIDAPMFDLDMTNTDPYEWDADSGAFRQMKQTAEGAETDRGGPASPSSVSGTDVAFWWLFSGRGGAPDA